VSRIALGLLTLALLGPLQAQQAKPAPPAAWPVPALDDKTYKRWLEFIRPGPGDLTWKKIPWRNDLLAAVQEAKTLQRPLLLWSDQGNPLGLVDMAPSFNTVVARNLVWADDEVQKLAANFLPVTAEVWTLATGTGPASEFFHKAGGPTAGGAAHGLYIFTPDGEGLGFQFLARPKEPVVALMTGALKKWTEIAAKKGYTPKPVPPLTSKETWPEQAAKSGLFLVAHARDLPRGATLHPGKDDVERGMWNLSFLDFTEKEAQGFLPSGGSKSAVPEAVLKKLVRRHLGDFSHGNNGGYAVDVAFKKGSMTTETVSVKEPFVTVRLHGEISLEQGTEGYDPKVHGQQLAILGDHRIDQPGLFGFQGTFHGKATFDLQRKKFVLFELVAAGTRKGLRGKDDYLPAPIGFAFSIEGQPEKPSAGDKKTGGP
jgi:hypothetical protein